MNRMSVANCARIAALFCILGAGATSLELVGAAPPIDAQDRESIEFFEKKIRPLLADKCWACHGPEEQERDLRLDSKEGVAAGGASGPVVVPGKPDASLLIRAVRRTGELQMPPDEKLTPAQIATLATWVQAGAIWPDTDPPVRPAKKADEPLFTEEEKSHWAYQKIRDPALPDVLEVAVTSTDGPRSDLDRFIVARLEAAGLVPAPRADKRTLIRRATFDLLGLPPTAAEIDQFLQDESPDAYAKLIDRLLESKHYGERWARHWLDVVRYADTSANDGNFVMRYAYLYRNYVIDAFNDDVPYDQFVTEQLAGDLIPPDTSLDVIVRRQIAPSFLMLGPKALPEADREQLRMDIVDELVDVTGRAFLGLTVACARCHDHKFDSIPTEDYYSIAGIFRSLKIIRDTGHITWMWTERPLLTLPGGEDRLPVMTPLEDGGRNLRVHLRGKYNRLGKEVPRRFLRIVAGEDHPPIETKQSGRLELARWIASPDNPLTARVLVNRIWQGHFGKGIVATSDNFGKMGQPPTHPELLDWLASRFIESGWSVKALHRLIMSSATYQQSSRSRDAAASVDPDNHLLWRMNRRRLEAEAIRDALLAISGQLDRKVGGGGDVAAELYAQGEVVDAEAGLVSASNFGLDYKGYQVPRRSIYLPVIRNASYEMLTVFDAADANAVTARRNDTTVATQAMFMMNNPFVRQQALSVAKKLEVYNKYVTGLPMDPPGGTAANGGGSTNITTDRSSILEPHNAAFWGAANTVDGDFAHGTNGGFSTAPGDFLGHSTHPESCAWVTVRSANANTEWVLFTFDEGPQRICEIRVWNLNGDTVANNPERGVKSMFIWATTDPADVGATSIGGATPGGNWTQVIGPGEGGAFTLEKAPGDGNYNGQTLDLGGVEALKLLFDIETNHGDTRVIVGLSEVQFLTVPTNAAVIDEGRIEQVHVEILGRPPTPLEMEDAATYLREYTVKARATGKGVVQSRVAALQSYCQLLFCLNEFLYVD